MNSTTVSEASSDATKYVIIGWTALSSFLAIVGNLVVLISSLQVIENICSTINEIYE